MRTSLADFAYTLCLALWVGGISIFTFMVTPIIFRSFDRDMAGRIVGQLFEGYFYYLLALSVAALLLFIVMWKGSSSAAKRPALVLLTAAVALNVCVSFVLYPRIKEVKAGIQSFAAEPENSPERDRFRKLHALGSAINLIILADGAALLLIQSKEKTKD